jgi:muramoyltetrapeptide carboxypeptidase
MRPNPIFPPRLQKGDSVGIISPSWGGAGRFPHRIEQATRHLESLGFKVKLAAHALNQAGFISDTAGNRLRDIHDMFLDPEVGAIIAAIGGDHACHLLPLLDFDLIRDHPKVFMGYSDITVLNVAIWQQTGMTTFNGPAILTDFAEHPKMFSYTERYFLKAVTQAAPMGVIEPSEWWTEEFQQWEEKKDLERPRLRQPSPGWTWLKEGSAEGILIGGCIGSLQHLRGTRFWPQWDEVIFFFETSEEKPQPKTVDGMLMDYQNMGVLDKIRGLIVGRPMYYTDEEKQQLREVILERTSAYDFPILTDADFGHTAPQITLPLGCRARLDSQNQHLEIIDPAVT